MGYAQVTTVEGRGQFSRRGGILDFFGGDDESPVRVEFFGDEVDRLSYFDPLSQRATSSCEAAHLLPSCEVVLDKTARERILKTIDKLLSTAKTKETKEKLLRERTVITSDMPVDFRDKYISKIYPEGETLFDYLSADGKFITITLGTNNCFEELKKQLEISENDKSALQNEGLIEEKAEILFLDENKFREKISLGPTVHVNNFAGGVGAMKLSGLFGFRSRRCVSYGGNFSMLLEDIASLRVVATAY
jgi:transcription-repair coupling factor (superfamily II helicase)